MAEASHDIERQAGAFSADRGPSCCQIDHVCIVRDNYHSYDSEEGGPADTPLEEEYEQQTPHLAPPEVEKTADLGRDAAPGLAAALGAVGATQPATRDHAERPDAGDVEERRAWERAREFPDGGDILAEMPDDLPRARSDVRGAKWSAWDTAGYHF